MPLNKNTCIIQTVRIGPELLLYRFSVFWNLTNLKLGMIISVKNDEFRRKSLYEINFIESIQSDRITLVTIVIDYFVVID